MFGTVNYAADDGVGRYNGRPGRHFTVSFKEAMAPVAAIIHKAGKIVAYNTIMACRLDCSKDIDAFFDERWFRQRRGAVWAFTNR